MTEQGGVPAEAADALGPVVIIATERAGDMDRVPQLIM